MGASFKRDISDMPFQELLSKSPTSHEKNMYKSNSEF